MKKILLFTLLLVLSVNALSAQRTWIGASSTNWSSALNWSPSSIPISSEDVIIPASVASGRFPNLTTTISRNGATSVNGSLMISGNGTLITNGAMTVNGTLTLNAGYISTNNSGTLINNGSISLAGNFTSINVFGGFTNNSGASLTIGTDANLLTITGKTINNAGTITLNSGAYIVNDGTLNNTGTISSDVGSKGVGGIGEFSGNTFVNPPNGNINLDKNLTNEYNCLIFNNGLTNNGTITFYIDGTTGCVNVDNIAVMSAMTFGGTFAASGSLTSGTVTLMTYGSHTGTFTNISAPLGNGYFLNISKTSDYGATTLTGTISDVALGVEFLNFEATTEGSKNTLTWQTATETNNKGFYVERKQGDRWEILDFVAAKGKAASYQFIDKDPLRISYYRLRQIDNDGKETYSKVISVSLKGSDKLKVYPNPVSDVLTVETTEASDFQIFNLLGQQVLTGKTPTSGAWGLDVSALPQGTYFLKVGAEQVKFIKN